jgi:hypothetical protein
MLKRIILITVIFLLNVKAAESLSQEQVTEKLAQRLANANQREKVIKNLQHDLAEIIEVANSEEIRQLHIHILDWLMPNAELKLKFFKLKLKNNQIKIEHLQRSMQENRQEIEKSNCLKSFANATQKELIAFKKTLSEGLMRENDEYRNRIQSLEQFNERISSAIDLLEKV